MLFAYFGGAEIDHFLGVAMDQQKVLVGVGFFLATVMFGLFGFIFGSLSSSFGPVYQQVRRGLPNKGYQPPLLDFALV